MAFENYPQPETTGYSGNNTPAKKSNLTKILLGVLIAALLGSWAYFFIDRQKTKEHDAQQDNQIAVATNEKDQLQKELEDAAMRYDVLKSSSTKKDSVITAKDLEIEAKKKRIQELLTKSNATTQELAEARRLIAELNSDISSYKHQIEVLEGQKIQLTNEKNAVTVERDVARRQFDSTNVVVKEKESIIDIGSTLHASAFNVVPINEKAGGKEKETTTAKRVDKLRISFDIDENRITQSGSKELFVIVYGPDGQPISFADAGSGTFNTREGNQKTFTKKLDINYQQSEKQNVSFDWKQPNGFGIGTYKVEVYNNGFKIGQGSKELKKGGLFG